MHECDRWIMLGIDDDAIDVCNLSIAVMMHQLNL